MITITNLKPLNQEKEYLLYLLHRLFMIPMEMGYRKRVVKVIVIVGVMQKTPINLLGYLKIR